MDISYAFPELVDSALQTRIKDKKIHREKVFRQIDENNGNGVNEDNADFILDGELMAYKSNNPLTFQELQKRLRKKI